MLDAELHSRLVKNYTDAAVGYTSAAGAAYVNFWSAAMGAWAQSVRSASDSLVPDRPAPPRSWYRHPDEPRFEAPQLRTPFDLWSEMLAPSRTPAAWPMAFMMLAFGAPRAIAWPTAEANAATLDSAAAVAQAFSSYRSDSGHAVAQIVKPAGAMFAWAAPAAATAWLPWSLWTTPTLG